MLGQIAIVVMLLLVLGGLFLVACALLGNDM